MPLYEYTIINSKGKLVTGEILAGCENGAKLKIHRQCAGLGEHVNRPGSTPYDQPRVNSVVVKNIKEIPFK
jgi:type II secretory pathway component PulF